MTKVIVVSDNHGRTAELEAIYEKYKDQTNYFIHCGDSELESTHELFQFYKSVAGNCDDFSFQEELFLNIEGTKILVCHGHYHSVKYDLDTLYQYAKEAGADVVCYGHTHYPDVFTKDGIVLINPGSIYANRGIRGRSFAVIEIVSNHIEVKHYDAQTFNEYIIK